MIVISVEELKFFGDIGRDKIMLAFSSWALYVRDAVFVVQSTKATRHYLRNLYNCVRETHLLIKCLTDFKMKKN